MSRSNIELLVAVAVMLLLVIAAGYGFIKAIKRFGAGTVFTVCFELALVCAGPIGWLALTIWLCTNRIIKTLEEKKS